MGDVRVTRREVTCVLLIAVGLAVAGLVWLFGAYGLICGAAGLAALALFGIDVREVEHRGEAVDAPDWVR